MKKINLNQLSMSWNEKQMPQKFRRYAGMLIMLLTLGVGQSLAGDNCHLGTGLTNVYMPADWNSWSTSTEALTKVSGNEFYGVRYVATNTSTTKNYQFKLYISWDNGSNYTYKSSGAGTFSSSNTALKYWCSDPGNVTVQVMAASSGYVKLDYRLWAKYDEGGETTSRLYIGQTAVSALSPSLSASSTSIPSGTGTSTITASCTGGSGGYNYSYTCRNITDNTDATSCLSATSGGEITFNAPEVAAEKIFRVTVTASDSESQLSGLATKTATKDITVNLVPSLTLTSISTTEMISGNNITINVARGNSSANITYQKKVNSGSWTNIATTTAQSYTYTVPASTGNTDTYYFRATMTDGSTYTTDASDAVTVYGKRVFYIKNNKNWGTLYLYAYTGETKFNGNWPGTSGDGSNGFAINQMETNSKWWKVTITSQCDNYIINNGSSGDGNQTTGIGYSEYADGVYKGCYNTSTGKFDSETTPSTPMLSTLAASTIREQSATMGGSVSALGNDIIVERGYYYSTNSALSSSNLGVGTKVVVSGTQSSTGAFSSNKNGLTAGTTYYVIAYAKNGFYTGYGSKVNFNTLSTWSVAVSSENTNKGTVNTASVTAGQYLASSSISATAKDGYRFKQWNATSPATLVSSATTNSNTVKTTGSGGAVQAQFDYRWVLRGSINSSDDPHGMPGWTTTTDYFTGISAGGKTGTISVTLEAKTKYKFKVYDLVDAAYYSKASTDWSGSNNTNTTKNVSAAITFTTTAPGTYTFTFNFDTKNVAITYPTTYSVTYGFGTGGSAVTATVGGVSIGTSPGYAVAGTNVVLGYTKLDGYDFKEWNTASNGSGTKLGTGDTYTISSISANATVYAIFTPHTYTGGTLDKKEGSADGSYSVTYLATSIASKSAPAYTGYNVEGYYEETGRTTKVADASGNLQKSTGYTDASNRWTYTSSIPTLYTKWTAKTYTVTLDDNGSYTSDGTATATYDSNTLTSITAPQRTGYSPEGYYTNEACTTKVATPAGDLQASTDYTTSGSLWKNDNDATLYTKWTANKYTVTLKPNEATTGSDQTVSATYDADMPGTTTSITSVVAPSKTGYDFTGFWDNSTNGSGTKYYNADLSSAHIWDKATNSDLWAQWSAKSYTITLDVDQTNKGSIDGATGSVSATYDATMPSIGGTLPTGANGYRYMGMYTAANGEGVALTDSLNGWKSDVDGYISDGKWVYAGTLTLYAYYQKAEITRLVLSPSTQAPGEDVTATPTIYPTPTGTTKLCWKLLRANGNEITGVTFTPTGEDDAVSFDAPAASGSYKVAAILRTGSICGAGTVLDSVVADLVVAGSHTVTIRYVDSDGRAVAASTSMEGRPLDWSDAIEPATVTGYTFARWDAGDGISITDDNGTTTKTTTTTASIKIKASYDGTLTAVYNKKKMIYFNNTLGWEKVYVYFYSNNKYWDTNKTSFSTDKGCGTRSTWFENSYTGNYSEMEQIAGTNIWYYDYSAAGLGDYANIVFCKDEQNNYDWFHNTEVVRLCDVNTGNYTSLPMYVPLKDPTEIYNKTASDTYTTYYTKGYWMNYPNNTGYWLKIFDKVSGTPAPVCIQDIPFEFTGDMTMPMSVTAELSAGVTYGFKIYRNDETWWGNNGTMKIGASGDESETAWEFETSKNNCGLKTSVAGDYTFTLTYGPKSSTYYYLVGVHYPVAENDYRIVYNDRVKWSQSTAHDASWYHASRTIHNENGAQDIVSFYVSKADGASASMKFQYASNITNEGVVTWTDVASGGSINLSSIEESGVYNFYLSQANETISVDSIRPYTGNYYIRTDNAGSTKWDNYRAADHQLTYSEFSKSRSTNTFGELYTHYYMHWCPRSTNIKFVIANDYSSCITDTLENDLVDLGNMISAGWLNSDGASKDYLDKFSANIRFMYNETTNKISRAYMSSSTNTARKFLVLRSNEEFWNSDGTDLTGSGETHDDANNIYEAIFKDNEDWIYEREVKLTPGKLFKIYASYAQATVQEEGSQHFRGEYADDEWTKDVTAVELIGGDGSACKARIIYDFKTNRLMAAYLPDNSEISGTLDINADIMIIREHQEAGQQITFKTNESQLTDVKTVYGVMRFNRWILNNRQHPEDGVKEHGDTDEHIAEFHPLVDAGSMKSVYDRALYWVSFPFDVNLSEVFGFGTYGVHWIMMDYNGAERARIGYWKDNEDGFWEYIEDRRGVTLEKGKGYVLALELDLMQANDNTFWSNQIQQVELFFPSNSSTTGTIKQTAVDVDVPDHECTIDRRTDKTVANWDKDRRVADSHWNIIGVPSYANYGRTLEDESGNTISWNSNPKVDKLPFLYEWNSNDNTYTVQSGTTFTFKAMHAYYVQYTGRLHWTLASATPSSIVARRTYAEEPQEIEFKLELQQNEKMVDQTFVKLSNDEEVSANFVFGEDMDKEFNAGKANVYTFIEGYIPTAGNTLPMSEQTTIIPMGVKIQTAGEYTFSIPNGTEGVGVTLIDNEAGTRTSLSALDYTVTLNKGTYDERFVIEISPIQSSTTDVEKISDEGLEMRDARKVIIDQKLFIIKGDKMYDARGAMVK